MTDKEKIRAEVERRHNYNQYHANDYAGTDHFWKACEDRDLLSFIDSMQEEPVCEDLEKEIKRYLHEVYDRDTTVGDIARHFAQWQKELFEKNRLKHCDSITNEQAELEQGFIDQHLDKYQRIPTFLDAIEYGMKLQKEQMMKDAIEGYWIARDAPDILHPLRIHDNKIERKILDDGRKYWYCRRGDSIYLPPNLFPEIQWECEPCKVKLLVLKEE